MARKSEWVVEPTEEVFYPDKTDKVILQALFQNCRTTLVTLQKLARLSKGAISNRMQRYENIGLISGYSALIHMEKLGLDLYAVDVKLSRPMKKEYVEHLRKIPFVNQVIVVGASSLRYLVRFYARDEEHADSVLTMVASKDYVSDIKVRQGTEVMHYPQEYFSFQRLPSKMEASFNKSFLAMEEPGSYDKLDLKILREISGDARASLSEIARNTGSNSDTVKYRMDRMIRQGIIGAFFTNMNIHMLDLHAYIVEIKIFEREKIRKIMDFIASYRICTGVIKYNHEWAVKGFLLFRSSQELAGFEKELFNRFPFIRDMSVSPAIEQPYYETFIPELIHE
mgnify:CR=1 FL=1